MHHLRSQTLLSRISALLIAALLLSACQAEIRPIPQARHAETHWNVAASLPLDHLAFLNVLIADPLVGTHYTSIAKASPAGMPPDAVEAADRLAEFRANTLQSNLSSFLYPWFSIEAPETLDDLIVLAGSLVEMNVYFHEDGWEKLSGILPDVKLLLDYQKAVGFDSYWQENLRPRLAPELERVQAEVEQLNIIPEIEKVLGFGLPSGEVTISLVFFEWPYGHHILGTHFSTIPEDKSVLRTTIHELLHNPFNNTDPAFWKVANALKDDPEFSKAFNARDPQYGYNDWPYYVAENSVRAREQKIEVDLGLGKRWSWREDGGMHQLAAALYELMEADGFPANGESYQQFFIRMENEGKLGG